MVCCTTGRVGGDLLVGYLENQLVMYLQQHLRRKLFFGQGIFHPGHGSADDVGGSALQARVDRSALIKGANRGVGGLDLGIMAFPAEQGLT